MKRIFKWLFRIVLVLLVVAFLFLFVAYWRSTNDCDGKNVTQYKPGDEVFGGRGGAFAEYVCRRATGAIALKPANVTFEQAAALNIAGITALQGIRDKGKVQAGQKVLVNGASGGVGTF